MHPRWLPADRRARTLIGTVEVVVSAVLVVAVVAAAIIAARSLAQRGRCPSCHKPTVEGQTHCPNCGTPRGARVSTPSPVGGPAKSVNHPLLLVVSGSSDPRRYPVTNKGVTMGRSADNSIQIDEPLVSRQHARIVCAGQHHVIHDLDSTNGTFVNGQRVASHALSEGDQIEIGPVRFLFRGPAGAPAGAGGPPTPDRVAPQPDIRGQQPALLGQSGAYTLQGVIGSGGMATVYKAVSEQDATTVAVKVLQRADPYISQKFEQEARIGLRLNHQNIARIYSHGQSAGKPYIVMEYVDGGTLRSRMKQGRALAPEAVAPIVEQVCSGLDYAHRMGIVHRDIKPENILFTSYGQVKLVDFGIAKVASAMTQTSMGMILGTPYYMSYEQARGNEVDRRSDVYSLGVVLYEMLTGRVPFTGEPLEVVHKHLSEQPAPPRKLNTSLPAPLDAAVLRALSKDIQTRFQSAAELCTAVCQCVGRTPLLAPGAHSPSELAGFERERGPRNAGLVILGGTRDGQVIELASGEIVLRRREIDPSDLLISREHAAVAADRDGFWLRDLNSRNGTFVNGRRIPRAVMLRDGDLVFIGNTTLRFQG